MRIFRHLSFSNVVALLALFIVLGGAAYAGTKINGKTIVNRSIGGGKLKNETITANKIKKGTITGAQIRNETITGAQIEAGSIDARQINLSTLGTVPSAQSANTAVTATKADSAAIATSATSADSAKHAESADSATSADTATNADNATRADTAGDADTLNGATAADLILSCQGATEFYGGMCWDETTRPARFWLAALKVCGDEGGRLPTIGELIAFVLRPGEQVAEQVWSGDLADVTGPAEVVLTSSETTRGKFEGPLEHFGYRCVFPRSN
jgi:hypothetical protein